MFYRRRVVVTGVGIVSPLGIGAKTSWEALLTGQSGLRALTDESIVGSEATGPLTLLPSRVPGLASGHLPLADGSCTRCSATVQLPDLSLTFWFRFLILIWVLCFGLAVPRVRAVLFQISNKVKVAFL